MKYCLDLVISIIENTIYNRHEPQTLSPKAAINRATASDMICGGCG